MDRCIGVGRKHRCIGRQGVVRVPERVEQRGEGEDVRRGTNVDVPQQESRRGAK